ncbi:uncharacterized protein KZ484_015721 isoform 2-T2 [Pholidichthys leucotaenia]
MARDYARTTLETVPPFKSCPGGEGEMDSSGKSPWGSSNFEVIDGLLYRRKLERGFINYREVLTEDRRHEAISTFHRRRPGQRHLSLEETYKCVAENYWWDGMYFQIRDFVLHCPECQHLKKSDDFSGRGCVTKTMASHSSDVLSKLRSQRETGLFCDITLRTNGRSFSAHRAVLAAVSDHFHEVFTEMDSSMKADIDLTGFSEDSLVSLLDFSYSSTLCVRQQDLPEVIAMARHLGMWPAVEACAALLKEQEQKLLSVKNFASACAGECRECQQQQSKGKRKRAAGWDKKTDSNYTHMLDTSSDAFQEGPSRNLRRTPKCQSHNGLPTSPSHRMKLMDFKSPSSKRAATSYAIATPRSPISPSHTHLLRSTPGAAKKVQKLLPMPETSRKNRKSPSITSRFCIPSSSSSVCSPVKLKQEVDEVGDDEEDYERTQEKYKLMNVLGLQRTALLPRTENLVGWRQKKRLRKLKINNYSLTKRRKPRSSSPGAPYGDLTLALPLCTPANTRLLNKAAKTKSAAPVSKEQITAKKPKTIKQLVPPSDRSMRSQGVLPDLFQCNSRPAFGGRELRRSVRKSDGGHQPLSHMPTKSHVRTTVKIKSESAEYSLSGLRLSSNNRRGNTSQRSVPLMKTQAKNEVAVETLKALRYNNSRPATKVKRRATPKEGEKVKPHPRVEGRKVGSQGPKGVTETRPKVKDSEADGLQFLEQLPPPSSYNHPLYKAIKEEPAESMPVVGPFLDPSSPDRGKRQSKPPIKLLDSGFLFSLCRPGGGPMAGLKKEEESVDICLTRSVSQVGEKFEESPHRILRARGAPIPPVVKREKGRESQGKAQRPKPNSQTNLHQAQSAGAKTSQPKEKVKLFQSNRNLAILQAARRARLKQLRGPRSQAPTVPKAAHACLQCTASYKDCDGLIMHQLRHVEGKHWPCPLCSKTFFRLKNVRNHIRTHEPKLYKCRSCIVAGS